MKKQRRTHLRNISLTALNIASILTSFQKFTKNTHQRSQKPMIIILLPSLMHTTSIMTFSQKHTIGTMMYKVFCTTKLSVTKKIYDL